MILVLGMHRSGTSFLAGTLQTYGLYSGTVHEWSKHNRRGNRENPDVMALNDALLVRNGASWDSPPKQGVISAWGDDHRAEGVAILEQMEVEAEGRPIGFKDPRTLLTLPFWEASASSIRTIGTLRSPVAVAKSLHSRDKSMGIEQGFHLWEIYNRVLLEEIAHDRCVGLVNFDWKERDLRATAHVLAQKLALPWSAQRTSDFYSTELRHQTGGVPLNTSEPQPSLAQKELYTELSHAAMKSKAGWLRQTMFRLSARRSRL